MLRVLSRWVALRQSTLLLRNVHIQQIQDNQTTIELQTEPPEAGIESTNLPDDDALNSKPVGGVKTFNNIIT